MSLIGHLHQLLAALATTAKTEKPVARIVLDDKAFNHLLFEMRAYSKNSSNKSVEYFDIFGIRVVRISNENGDRV